MDTIQKKWIINSLEMNKNHLVFIACKNTHFALKDAPADFLCHKRWGISSALCFGFFACAVYYGKRGAGSDLHVRRRFDWHGGVSQYALRRASRQAGPDPGNKKTRSPVCLKTILLQRGESLFLFFFYTSFTVPKKKKKKGNGGRGSRCWKSFRKVRVCECVCELSADAGSLGHLAGAKEKGKLLHCCCKRNFLGLKIHLFGKANQRRDSH